MLKSAYFLKRKSCLSVGKVKPPFASGGCPALFLSSTITTLSSSFQALNAFYYLQSEQNNYSNVLLLLFPHFYTIFHLKLCSFCWWGAHEYFLPQDARYPSYASASVLKMFTLKKNTKTLSNWGYLSLLMTSTLHPPFFSFSLHPL